MSGPAMARAALNLPALSALVLMLSGTSLPAQSLRAIAGDGRPGTATVTITPEATVVSTDHYQATLTLTCNGSVCNGSFPAPGAHRRLHVTRMTCGLTGTAAFDFGLLVLRNANQRALLVQHLPVDYSSPNSHSLNHAVDVQAASTQHIEVTVALVSGAVSFASCSATGTLATLR